MAGTEDGLKRSELAERLRHFNMSTHLANADLIAGGVVALSAVVGLQIVSAPATAAARAPLWVGSFTLFMMIHANWRQGGLLMGARLNVGDYLTPMLLGLFEFAQFLVISNDFQRAPFAALWCAMVAGQLLFAAALVHSRVVEIARSNEYAEDAADFTVLFQRWNRNGRNASALIGAIMAAAAAWAWLSPASALAIARVAAAIGVLFSLLGLYGSTQSQRMFMAFLRDEPDLAAVPKVMARDVRRALASIEQARKAEAEPPDDTAPS